MKKLQKSKNLRTFIAQELVAIKKVILNDFLLEIEKRAYVCVSVKVHISKQSF